MAGKQYVVTAAAVAVTVQGRLRYLYRGDAVPGGISTDHLKTLAEMNMIGEAKTAEEKTELVVPDGEPVDKPEWTIAVLRKYAADHDISLGEAKSRPELLAAVVKKPE